MELSLHPSNRWCVAGNRDGRSPKAIQREILLHKGVNERFTLVGTPAPARDQTLFKTYIDGPNLLIAVAVFDSAGPTTRIHYEPLPNRHSVEIFFAPWNDELGWFQFCFQPDGSVQTFNHIPYPEAHSTSMPMLKVRRYHWEHDTKNVANRLYWLFAWFPLKQIFRNADACGFNVARTNPPIEEFSTWNHASAVGSQDATCFGKLYLTKPTVLPRLKAEWEGNRLTIKKWEAVSDGRPAGISESGGRPSETASHFALVNPLGERIPITLSKAIAFRAPLAGRYRIVASNGKRTVEPEYLSFDVAMPQHTNQFRFSVLYDIPDNIQCTNYYTPERLKRELGCWKEWGIQRIYWLEYGPLSHWRSFWDQILGNPTNGNPWSDQNNVPLTRKHCDDIVRHAARAAKKHGLEFFGIFKPFDMGANNGNYVENDGYSCVREIEECYGSAMPEIVSHPQYLMRRHPEWRRREVFPITRVVLYSENPIPSFPPSKLSLWTCRDNLHYTKYRKPFRVTQGAIRRPHYRWTPAGKMAEAQNVRNWRIEISNLDLQAPFIALEIEGQDFEVGHRAFAFAEAWSDGQEAPVTLSTGGNRKNGFVLGKGRWGWANSTEAILDEYSWKGGALGMLFREEEGPSNLLEPGYDGARKIWLDRLRPILESEADGVDIRTLGHHNGTMSYLANAFAEPVREAFRKRYGRAVEPTHEDYTVVRKLRGEAYTQFLREAKALAARHRKKLSAHLEWGVEVPTHLDIRMAMELDWRTWIGEKIVDEVTLRGWQAQNPYVHRHILPLARRMKVPVHIISACLPNGIDLRAMEVCERFVTEACAAGFSGFCLYETDNLLRMNREGFPMPLGLVDEAVRKARRALDRLGDAGYDL